MCSSLPSNTVCAGTPAKVIKTLDEYYQKRKENYIADAKENARYILKHTGRLPEMGEMLNFIVLFMPRTPDNIQKYVLNKHRVGGSSEKYAEILRSTEQLYPDFQAFLIDTFGSDIVSKYSK